MFQHDTKLSELTGQLLQKKITIACAESCTGGLICERLTQLPGSSAWFDCGLVTYSNESKQQLLGLSSTLIQQHGVVSAEVAEAMLRGLFACTKASIGVSVTGFAGPEGGLVNKPVGTVFIGVGARTEPSIVYECCFLNQPRERVRISAYEKALDALIFLCKTL